MQELPQKDHCTSTTIENPIALEIERLSAQARELVALAMELNELYEAVAELMAVALELSRRAAEMQRNGRRIKRQYSPLVN
jgi:hypothetical protein